ncbi:MAG TPA: DUF2125 domain-containing protein [Paenirhodobacter sp.]
MRILRWLGGILGGIVLLATVASWFGGQEIAHRARIALTEMEDLGRARAGSVTATGFPFRLGVEIKDLTLMDGPRIEIPRLVATAPMWGPLDWSGALSLPTVVTLNGLRFNITGTSAQAGLQAGYGAGWPVRGASLTLTDPVATMEAAAGPSLSARALRLAAAQDADAAYRIDAVIEALALPPGLAASLTPTARFPDTIESITAHGRLTFTSPFTLAPQPAPLIEALSLDIMRIVWDGHEITLSGSLTVGPLGQPEGTLQLRVHDWQDWLEFAQGALRINRRVMPVLMILGNTLSQATGDGSIAVPLIFRGGQMALGPVPLGAAPVLR